MKVFAALEDFFYVAGGQSLNDALRNRTNPFITGFSQKAARVAARFNNIEAYIIWNEPNAFDASGQHRNPATNFAALVNRCRETMGQSVNLVWGGIQLGPNYDGLSMTYIESIYEWFNQEYDVLAPDRSQPFKWPWNMINIHIHNDRNGQENDIGSMFKKIREIQGKYGDNSPVIVGEWGIRRDAFASRPQALTELYSAILSQQPEIMFFYSHYADRDPRYPSLYWGIQAPYSPSNPAEPGFWIDSYDGQNWAFRLTTTKDSGDAFYNAYDSLIGS
ncbi:MAG: hypothetical protein IT306_19210 [Chloroflexi bacterium]|nr:hypothetical protein [Chloroflexota bacterium]